MAIGRSPRNIPGAALALYILLTGTLIAGALVLAYPKPQHVTTFFGAIGLIATWRYGWWLVHVVRAVLYLRHTFPRMRDVAESERAPKCPHVYAIVMSYQIAAPEFRAVYAALLRNAVRYGRPTTIVASITCAEDRKRLEEIWVQQGSPSNVEIISQFQRGDGKRSAMGIALRTLARRAPAPDAAVVFLDGDIVLEERAFEKTLSVLAADPGLGAVTTNNDAIVTGSYLTRQWYFLRYAQRHLLMSSMSLSGRLLVLTGRFSVFRAEHAADPAFISIVESDAVDHWRLGRIELMSGDDKSTWHHMMRIGARMAYIPDAKAYGLEALPDPARPLLSTTQLMRRWFGNMLRANGRAIALGPRRTGAFTWWCLIDQRLSMWTSLIGPMATLLFSVTVSPIYLVYYALWVLLTRTVMGGVAGLFYGRFSPAWPLLMYYNQIWGAMLKVYLLFRLDRQSWIRQGISSGNAGAPIDRWVTRAVHAAAIAVLAYIVAVSTFLIPPAGVHEFRILAGSLTGSKF